MSTFLKANWEHIIMANYAVPVTVLKPYLPNGVELDVYQGKAYVSLVGFMFKNTKLFRVPIPWLGTFEEINLRFYVKRKDGNNIKRGVVFVNETVPYKIVAWVANKLYKEHYTAILTRHHFAINDTTQSINYAWKIDGKWNSLSVESSVLATPMIPDSFEAFIFEHYYGYTKINTTSTEEYKVQHPSWNVYAIKNSCINCNFTAMYGKDFSFLNNTLPVSVFMAEGSAVEVAWKRNRLPIN